jgi:hypothetical protein
MLTDEQKAVLESTATGSTSDDVITLGGDTIQLDLGNMGAAQSIYSYPDISGIGTISINGLDLTNSYSGTTITLPSSSSTCYTTTTGYNWSQPYSPTVNIDNSGVNIKEGGDIKIGDKSLSEAIQKIEERLAILKPNPEMEEKWDELRSLGERYRALEKELYEKEKMWEILKRDE